MSTFDANRQMPASVLIGSAFFLLLLFYHLIFGSFFPNYQGFLGNDYSGLFPALLNGYFWFKTNSLFDVPWFSPAFCGGQPFYADVQSIYYSVVQFLTLFVDPLTSVYLSILLFASAGFWSMFYLLKQRFNSSNEAAFLAATLFMFNGFYAHRMLIGHFGFQGIMLIPLAVWLLLPAQATPVTAYRLLLKSTLSALLLAYWLQSGMASLIVPVGLSVFALVCLAHPNPTQWKLFFCHAIGAISIALALSAAKLSVGIAFMSHFQRSDYLLPGVEGFFHELHILFIALFFSPADMAEIAYPHLKQVQWALERHEWEFGITVIPLLLIIAAWVKTGWQTFHPTAPPVKTTKKSLWINGLLLISLIIPLLINLYTPSWNALLKQTPLLKSSSALFRWWLVYIPLLIVYAALSLEKLALPHKLRAYLVRFSVLIVLGLNLTADRLLYQQQSYSPDTIIKAYQDVAAGNPIPAINQVNAFFDAQNNIQLPVYRNDLLTLGASQLACYNPSFGYRLEKLPLKSLHIGSIFAVTNGYLNLKNPACYVFPTENHCQPGDHFAVSEKTQATAFAQYQPFSFAISNTQKIANLITQSTLLLVFGFLGWVLFRTLFNLKRMP